MSASPYVPYFWTIGVIFALFLYLVDKSRYFAIGVGILALLYGTGFIPLSAFIGPLMMIFWGEYCLSLFKKTGHNIVIYALGSATALLAAMLYTNEFEPLVGVIALIVLLMLRSILKDRDDGSMIGLLGVGMTITLFEDLQYFVDYQTLAFQSSCALRYLPTGPRRSISAVCSRQSCSG